MAKIRVSLRGAQRFRGSSAEKLIARAARAAFSHFGFDFNARVDIELTDDAGIHKINLAHRGMDKPTDVLSFPMADFAKGRPRFDPMHEREPGSGLVFLGDIVISLERARAQAEQYGHGFARECAYLTVHSMLHLMGYDHKIARQKARMRREEEQIMALLGLERVTNGD